MSIKDVVDDVKKGKMGAPAVIAGIYSGRLVEIEVSKTKKKADKMFVLQVAINRKETRKGMGGRKMKTWLVTTSFSYDKMVARILMQAGFDISSLPDDSIEEYLAIKEALLELADETPKVKIAVTYQMDRKTGGFALDDYGKQQSEIEIIEVEPVLGKPMKGMKEVDILSFDFTNPEGVGEDSDEAEDGTDLSDEEEAAIKAAALKKKKALAAAKRKKEAEDAAEADDAKAGAEETEAEEAEEATPAADDDDLEL